MSNDNNVYTQQPLPAGYYPQPYDYSKTFGINDLGLPPLPEDQFNSNEEGRIAADKEWAMGRIVSAGEEMKTKLSQMKAHMWESKRLFKTGGHVLDGVIPAEDKFKELSTQIDELATYIETNLIDYYNKKLNKK